MRPALKLGVVLVGMIVFASAGTARAADPFEGKWKVTLTSDGAGGKDMADTLVFTRGGKFYATELKKKGFGEVNFDSDTRRFGPAAFTAEQTSAKEGKAKWEGHVAATEMEGTMVLTKKDGSVVNYTFKGSKQQ